MNIWKIDNNFYLLLDKVWFGQNINSCIKQQAHMCFNGEGSTCVLAALWTLEWTALRTTIKKQIGFKY